MDTKEIQEFEHWNNFINELLTLNYEIYIRGGSVLGLEILKISSDTPIIPVIPIPIIPIPNIPIPTQFLENKLIRDWDFVLECQPNEYEFIKKMAWKYNIIRESQ